MREAAAAMGFSSAERLEHNTKRQARGRHQLISRFASPLLHWRVLQVFWVSDHSNPHAPRRCAQRPRTDGPKRRRRGSARASRAGAGGRLPGLGTIECTLSRY